jgi:PEP-CTERM motif
MTLRELVYDLFDEGRRAGDFALQRDAIDQIAAGMIDTLNDRDEGWGPCWGSPATGAANGRPVAVPEPGTAMTLGVAVVIALLWHHRR